MIELSRVTSDYVESDDRICLTGETESGEPVKLWLTQRLLIRLLPHLFNWLEHDASTDISFASESEQSMEMFQIFAQQAARDGLTKQKRVTTDAESLSLLVSSVDINRGKAAIKLIFNGPDQEKYILVMRSQQLRQWIAIINTLWQKAHWPQAIWPRWMKSGKPTREFRPSEEFH